MLLQQGPVLVFDDRWKLVQIADHQQLNAAEGQVGIAVGSQDLIDGIEHIGSDHTYFVDDQKIKGTDDAYFLPRQAMGAALLAAAGTRDVQSKRELEKRVDRHATSVYGGDSRRRDHHQLFHPLGLNGVQERRLAAASLTSQEKTSIRIANKVESQF